MECAQTTWLSNKEYLQQLSTKVADLRVPLYGSIDLTHRCNLRCVHCYLGDKGNSRRNRKQELGTSQWISIIDEITKAGCLNLLLTGGEPLLREDFNEIYRRAKTNGLLVTVFTNGTLITDSILKLFGDLPPRIVEISLYGATAPTYEKITGVKGSYEQSLKGIQSLLDHRINLKLKTILMTLNRHEFYDMETMSKEYGVKFRFDAAIFPCLDDDKSPLQLRVSPEEAIEKEFSDDDRSRQWKEFFERMQGFSLPDTLYNCGSGLTSFHIDPYGQLQPCLMVTSLRYNLLEGSFVEGWGDVIPLIRERKAGAAHACNRCEKMTLCGFCPGFFKLENGAEDIYSQYLCALGKCRFEAIASFESVEDQHANYEKRRKKEASLRKTETKDD
jgi:radical SAM protein with 4Fe4S-binding SPASM domain